MPVKVECDFFKYLRNDTLVIQVDATLFCLTDTAEQLKETPKIPLDNIREEMLSLYKNEVFSDVTMKCGEEEFKVHRVILAQSPVFKKMLEVDMKEKECSVVEVTDIDPPVMAELLSHLYSGTAPANLAVLVKELLHVAHKYQLPRLFAMCENELLMEIRVASVIDFLLLADRYGASNLKLACLQFIHNNSAQVHKTQQWRMLKGNLTEHAEILFEIAEFSLKLS